MKFSFRLFFSRNLDALIDLADEYIFHGKLEKIIEVTYTYREIDTWCYLNETIFEEYLWLSYPHYSIEKLCLKYKFRIGLQILQIESLIKKAKKIIVFSRSQSMRKTLFIEALQYIKVVLEVSKIWADFEMEKALWEKALSIDKTQKLTKEIEKREKFLFGEKIIDNFRDYQKCLNYLYTIIDSKKNIKKFSTTNDSANKLLEKIVDWNKTDFIKEGFTESKKNVLTGGFMKKYLSRKDYREIFDRVCEIYWLPQRTKITSASSIYDGDNFLEIPRSKSFSELSFERVLKLITHEIESHYINVYNNNLFIWKFRSAWNLPKEEWIAMFMEQIFYWFDINNFQNIIYIFFPILWWESLEWDDYYNFMKIFWLKYNLRADYKMSLLRAKRNYSIYYKGVQHKDISYSRWLDWVVKYLQEWWEFYKLFLGKVWFHDIDNNVLLYMKSKKKNKAVFPIFFSDLIYYYLKNKYKDSWYVFNVYDFYFYLKKKYWFLDIERLWIINRLNTNKKKIKSLLELIFKKLNSK